MSMSKSPLMPEVGVLALVYHEWGNQWMTPHHVLTRLADYFHVVWSEPPHGWREIVRSVQKRRASSGDRELKIPKGFQLYVPEPWLPKFYRPNWMDQLTFRLRLARGIHQLEKKGCRKFVLYLWHPQFGSALQSTAFDVTLYHVDDEYSFSPINLPLDSNEADILKRVDQVFAVSPGLIERKGGINVHTAFIPEGVDYSLYATRSAEPADLASIGHPRIGYTGNLKKWLDWHLLLHLAANYPELQFVFVGPVLIEKGDELRKVIDELVQHENVHFLGPKSVKTLATYPQHFDVCIMPYLVNDYTNNIYPLKLHEYLASGRPVVSSTIKSIEDFSSVINLAGTADEWARALGHALQPVASRPEMVAARRTIAREHDWKKLIFSLAAIVSDRLGLEYSERFLRVAKPN